MPSKRAPLARRPSRGPAKCAAHQEGATNATPQQGGAANAAGNGGDMPAIPRNFKEGCWHCGDPNHRRQECPKYAAEVQRRRAAMPGPAKVVNELGTAQDAAGWPRAGRWRGDMTSWTSPAVSQPTGIVET